MPSPFLSSEEYDERAHQLYNEGHYDEALALLREGLGLYPNAVERLTGGRSRQANLALLEQNAAVAGTIASALAVAPP